MMKIEIYPPLALHEKGKRAQNEDAIFPSKGGAHEHDALFLVCDGIGGSARGEEASSIVCEAFDYSMDSGRQPSTPGGIAQALAYAEEQIDKFVENNPEARGMGTTMTLLHLHENGATVAHVGDSRVYHIRERTIRFVTSDHKWVNKLVLSGDLSPEEAVIHPSRNIIDRAILGRQERATHADVIQLIDIRAGDYFFLCTDGVLEGLEENQLVNILASDASDVEKISAIETLCQQQSTDNFSAYLVRIRSVRGAAVPWTPLMQQQGGEDEVIAASSKVTTAPIDVSPYPRITEAVQSPTAQTILRPPASATELPPDSYTVDENTFQKLRQGEKQKLFQTIVVPALIVVLCPMAVLGGFHFYRQFISGQQPPVEQSSRVANPADRPSERIPEKPRPMNKNNQAKQRKKDVQPPEKREMAPLKPAEPAKKVTRPEAGKATQKTESQVDKNSVDRN